MHKKKMVIVTSSVDETATYIMDKYSDIVQFFRLDVDCFSDYVFCIDNYGWEITNNVSQCSITERETNSIYYRKPMMPDVSLYEDKYQLMIQRDIISLINGITDSFQGKVLTKPSILRMTENKIFQLMYAVKNGLKVPTSYIGNSNDFLQEFAQCESIIKPLTTGKVCDKHSYEIYQTSMLRKVDDNISLTPVYLQTYIPKQYEVRVTIVNKKFYAVRIDTLDKVDWRKDYQNHKYTLIECPETIKNQCNSLMSYFGLVFGCFDYIVTPADEWIFLEINPNGQWQWLEENMGLDISLNIVNYLLN